LEDIHVERDLDVVLRHMYREVQQENTEGCVSEERLDEKDVAMMDVLEFGNTSDLRRITSYSHSTSGAAFSPQVGR
jgi:hypothetical protein